MLSKNGQQSIDTNIELSELIKPSIFDDQSIQDLKKSLVDVQEYKIECKQLETIQP